MMQRMIDGGLPLDGPFARDPRDRWDENFFLPEPKQNLADRVKLLKFAEDERDAVPHPAIGILLDAVVVSLHVTDGNGQMKFTAARLLANGLDRPLTKNR